MLRFTVNLFQDERQALVKLAQEERRAPRDQAALIIRQELERRGLLPADAQRANEEQSEVKNDRRIE